MILLKFKKLYKIVSAVAIVLISSIIVSCSLNPAEEDSEPIIVNFTDPNFEALIREILEISERKISNHDMWTIKEINGIGRNIFDISGIEYCTGVTA
ncbi:MAG: hypothetical protein V3W20_00645, partial [Candidatus Neomarinimicrobiota bacterium]